jgi:hypothetical protein
MVLDGIATTDATLISLTHDPGEIHIGTNFSAGAIAQVAIFAGVASDALITAHVQGVHPTGLPGRLLECWDLDRVGPIAGVRGTILQPILGGSLAAGPNIQGPPTRRRLFTEGVAGGVSIPRLLSRASSLGTGVR